MLCGICVGRCLITDVIDQEQAAEGLMVQYGVCEQLDALKDAYHSLPDYLTEVRKHVGSKKVAKMGVCELLS